MQLSNLSLNGSQRRTCILDLSLVLSPIGVTLVKNLSQVMELWVVRELWHILDSFNFYIQRPELITPSRWIAGNLQRDSATIATTVHALHHWQQFRMEHDLAGLNLFWLGDSLQESLLPQRQHLPLFYRWEAIAQSLDGQFDESSTTNLLPLSVRDAIALTVCLESSFVLTYQPWWLPEDHAPPAICHVLESWGIACQELPTHDTVVEMERAFLRHLFLSAGLAPLLWQAPKLIALYISTPAESAPAELQHPLQGAVEPPNRSTPLWNQSKGFWYTL